MNTKPSGKIKVNGRIYETFIDEEGTRRFKPNNLIHKMKIGCKIQVTKLIELYELESITIMDLLDYYTGIGFTVSGVEELSFFEHLVFEEIIEIEEEEKISLLFDKYAKCGWNGDVDAIGYEDFKTLIKELK